MLVYQELKFPAGVSGWFVLHSVDVASCPELDWDSAAWQFHFLSNIFQP